MPVMERESRSQMQYMATRFTIPNQVLDTTLLPVTGLNPNHFIALHPRIWITLCTVLSISQVNR